MLSYYDFNALADGGQEIIHAAGSYFRYYAGAAGGADTRIIVRADGGLAAILKPGQAVRLPDGKTVGRWTIENYSKAANILGSVVVGSGQIDDSTITGDVNVIDGALSRTLSNQAFLKNNGIAAVAAQYAQSQLFNPVGSGKYLYLESAVFSSATAQTLICGYHNAAYSTLGGAVMNKYLGGAAGVGVVRRENNAGQIYTNVSNEYNVAASAPVQLTLKEPILIPPGFGHVVMCNTVNTALSVNYEWYEQGI